jgi:presenilin-like A22 family membrane protease
MKGLGSRVLSVLCALLAYTVSRLLFGEADKVWSKLPEELGTFVGIYVLLQMLFRGRKLARKGKQA